MEKVSDIDVRLLNALDIDFDDLYDASKEIVEFVERKASKDMEYILHRPIMPGESRLIEMAFQLHQYLYNYKNKQWESPCDSQRERELNRERMKIYKHHEKIEEKMANQKRIVVEPDDMESVDGIYYHGTDLRIVKMTDEERASYKKDCMLVIDYMWQFFGPYYQRDMMIKELKEPLDFYEDETLYYNLQDALTRNNARQIGNQLYQYDCFYLTSLKRIAKDYAWRGFAGGEIGLTAYRMIEGARQMKFDNINPSEDIKAAIDRVVKFAQGPAQPVYFVFKDLDRNYLELENGASIDWTGKGDKQNVRYTKNINIDYNNAVEVKLV